MSVDGTIQLERLEDVLYVGRMYQGQPESTVGVFKIVDGGRTAVRVPVKHELEEAPLAADALRSAASTSGGRFYREESLHELAPSLVPRETVYTLRQEVILWGAVPFLVFTGLVAGEWLLRKLTNLS